MRARDPPDESVGIQQKTRAYWVTILFLFQGNHQIKGGGKGVENQPSA